MATHCRGKPLPRQTVATATHCQASKGVGFLKHTLDGGVIFEDASFGCPFSLAEECLSCKAEMRDETTVLRKKTATHLLAQGAWVLAMVGRTRPSTALQPGRFLLLLHAASQPQLTDRSMDIIVALVGSFVKSCMACGCGKHGFQ